MIELTTSYNSGRITIGSVAGHKSTSVLGNIKDVIANYFRNKAIDERIKKLSRSLAGSAYWASLSDLEKEREVRRITSVRHAIERMKRMKR